jgi:cytoskeletal protein CcmA (bactofilin family)
MENSTMFSRDSKPTRRINLPEEIEEKKPAMPIPTPTANHVPSIISADLKVLGQLISEGDLQIDGMVEGDVTSRVLTVGQSGRVEGTIKAQTVRVAGSVTGEICADAVVLQKTAHVASDITQRNLTMEPGAVFEGRVSQAGSDAGGKAKGDVTPLRSSGTES